MRFSHLGFLAGLFFATLLPHTTAFAQTDAKRLISNLKAQAVSDQQEREAQAKTDANLRAAGVKPAAPEEIADKFNQGMGTFAAALGTTPDSPEMKRVSEAVTARLLGKNAPAQLAPDPRSPNPKLTAHFRFKEGIALPSEEQIKAIEKKELEVGKDVAFTLLKEHHPDIAKEMTETYQKRIDEFRVPPPKQHCEISQSSTTPSNVDPAQIGPFADVLFTDTELPFNPNQTIGKNIIVIQYASENTMWLSALYGRLGIPCLPFRMRNVGDDMVYTIGDAAYLNFDKDPAGSGTLDPTVHAWLVQQQTTHGGSK